MLVVVHVLIRAGGSRIRLAENENNKETAEVRTGQETKEGRMDESRDAARDRVEARVGRPRRLLPQNRQRQGHIGRSLTAVRVIKWSRKRRVSTSITIRTPQFRYKRVMSNLNIVESDI